MGATPCSLPSAGVSGLCYSVQVPPHQVAALPWGRPLGSRRWRSRRVPWAGAASPGAVCVRLAAPPPSPGRQVPWAGWLERERCLPSHARHELVESCDSPDAFLDIHSSYSASGKGESITGSTSVCVGGGRERTTDNGFVEGMILGFNYYFSGFSVALGYIAARGLS